MRSKLGLAIAFVIALALGTNAALANSPVKTQNANSSTTSTALMKTGMSKRRHHPRRKRHSRKNRMKRNMANGNGNTRK